MTTQVELERRRRQMRRRIRLALVQRRVTAVQPPAGEPSWPAASAVGVEPAAQDRRAGADHGDLDPLVA